MEITDAIREVLTCTDGADPDAVDAVKDYFRENEGMVFDGDDALGERLPIPGDKCVFLPLADQPPADRPAVQGPIAGEVVMVIGPFDRDYPAGFPYKIRLDDARDPDKCTVLWANRDEVHITAGKP